MQGYQRNYKEQQQQQQQQQEQRDDETIVVDMVPPQYQLSPPHSPQSGNIPKTPEKGLNLNFWNIYVKFINESN